jgi:hypothetical protein
MSKLCPSCNGYQYVMTGGINKTKCTACNGIGYVFDKPVEAAVEELEQKAIDKVTEEAKVSKKKVKPKKKV